MYIAPDSDNAEPHREAPAGTPEPDPTSSAELTPPTDVRRVVAGVVVPVSAILSWILATTTHRGLWYSLVAIAGVFGGGLYRSGGRRKGEDR